MLEYLHQQVYTGRFSVPASLHPVECENYCIDPQTEVEICPNEVKLHLQSTYALHQKILS